MKKVFIIGGMGAGKSTARKALEDLGLQYIDLDEIGHEIHHWPIVKDELVAAFGEDILDENGEINRPALAQKAFVGPDETRTLNRITQPRIEDAFATRLDELEAAGCPAVVVEYSVFKSRQMSLAYRADVIVAIAAPLETRVKRAVASGFEEQDVRRRIAQQITDAERAERADVVFDNDGTEKELYDKVVSWWKEYTATT
ncbi:MAG: dephospho-CoA kinase [Eggerthellaceae bacterium]|jgi:dephospho-CoA kinase|nr:dephospho-CoA kinase [Eggerthellaceae bacterium]